MFKLAGLGSTRESFLRCVSEPLAIVSLTLQGMRDDGPSKMVYQHLIPYLQGNALYANIDFNLGTTDGSKSFLECLDILVDMLGTDELKWCMNNISNAHHGCLIAL